MEDRLARSKRYSALKLRFFLADVLVYVLGLICFQMWLARPLFLWVSGTLPGFYLSRVVFSAILLLFTYVLSFPAHLTVSFFVEHKFGLSRQTFGAWVSDELKSVILSGVLGIGCVLAFYSILRFFPEYWWAVSAAAWLFFSVALTSLMPVLIIPLFYKYMPIEDAALKTRIMDLAERSGIKLMDVCGIDLSSKTVKANAAVVGLGMTRKVVLADTLTNNFSADEVDIVVAHEFGHHKYRHVRWFIMFSGAATIGGFYLLFRAANRIAGLAGADAIADPYILPALLLLMTAFGFVILPIRNLLSRVLERQADAFSLTLTGRAEPFITAMRRLADTNLADTDPSVLKKIFFYNHPPISERIRMAERFGDGGKI